MKPKRRCSVCGDEDRELYVHRGPVFCARCLTAHPDDDLITQARITVIRAQETLKQSQKLREGREK